MTNLLQTSETIRFKNEATIEPYTEAFSAQISGSRAEGSVRGVKLTYESDVECKEGINYSVTLAVECDD